MKEETLTTCQKVTINDLVDMANSMPLELLCILAHQSEQVVLTPVELDALVGVFPDEKFASIKLAIRSDEQLASKFMEAMLFRLRRAQRLVNFTVEPLEIRVTGADGLVWTYGGDENSVFQVRPGVSSREQMELLLAVRRSKT